MTLRTEDFRKAVRTLHREKDKVYRDAWKKRGEVLSILANIARKVDRLEYAFDGASNARDESLLDTAVDLFVYCLKYQTYLADCDASAAGKLFEKIRMSRPYSEGPAGFEYLLAQVDLAELEAGRLTVAEAGSQVLRCFAELESYFSGLGTQHPAIVRLVHSQRLTEATVSLIGALKRDDNSMYRGFVLSNTGEIV